MSVAEWSQKLSVLSKGLPQCSADLPPAKSRDIAIEGVSDVPHAPKRNPNLTSDEFRQAVKNVLRYFPQELHATLAPEFAAELKEYGHIYCYRLLPEFLLKAAPVEAFPAKTQQARCIMHMICNNLSNEVAQFPRELITYGGNGSVFNNWAQFWLVMQYLSEMTQEQTLVMNSGHPQGLYPSHADAPRCVLTNGMVVPNWSTLPDYERMYAMCNTMYGQMTAGSWCYIGPQGIVHGTTLTLLNGARKYLDLEDMSGVCYVSSGLGGMSGAQGKAAVICGAVTIIAEVDPAAMHKRHEQGWVQRWSSNLDEVIQWAIDAKKSKQALSIAYLGNVVDLWERLVEEAKKGNKVADLGSDQTSLHNPYGGGYYPVQLSFEESQRCMVEEPERFKQLVQESLRRQFAAINALSDEHGLKWWDYGNSALLEASRAGAAVENTDENNKLQVFKYPSYVEDIMGDIFALGFGPFRWVCCSGSAEDLRKTDEIAAEVMRRHIAHLEKENTPVNERTLAQYRDN
ncbi:MAG: Urocanate hydratase, partial [Cercozoa sp. M6MM]